MSSELKCSQQVQSSVQVQPASARGSVGLSCLVEKRPGSGPTSDNVMDGERNWSLGAFGTCVGLDLDEGRESRPRKTM